MQLYNTNALREHPLLTEKVTQENGQELQGFVQNIRKKSSRLVNDYCKYYISKLAHYPGGLEVSLEYLKNISLQVG